MIEILGIYPGKVTNNVEKGEGYTEKYIEKELDKIRKHNKKIQIISRKVKKAMPMMLKNSQTI